MENLKDFIKDNIRQQILSGKLPASKPLPSCRNLGRVWGACAATVSAAINDLVEENLVNRKIGRKFYPNPPDSANSCDVAISKIYVLLTTDLLTKINDPYISPLIEGVDEAAKLHPGVDIEYVTIKGDSLRSSQNDHLRLQLFAPHVAVIVTTSLPSHDIAFLSRSHIPFVVLNCFYSTDAPIIVVNDKMVIEYFIQTVLENSFKNIGLLEMTHSKQGEKERVLLSALKEHAENGEINFDDKNDFVVDESKNNVKLRLKKYLSSQPDVEIFLVGGDYLFNIIQELREEFSKYTFFHYSDGSCSCTENCIKLPTQKQAFTAVEILLGKIQSEQKVITIDPIVSK